MFDTAVDAEDLRALRLRNLRIGDQETSAVGNHSNEPTKDASTKGNTVNKQQTKEPEVKIKNRLPVSAASALKGNQKQKSKLLQESKTFVEKANTTVQSSVPQISVFQKDGGKERATVDSAAEQWRLTNGETSREPKGGLVDNKDPSEGALMDVSLYNTENESKDCHTYVYTGCPCNASTVEKEGDEGNKESSEKGKENAAMVVEKETLHQVESLEDKGSCTCTCVGNGRLSP